MMTTGQDRESYTDTQDRESYTVTTTPDPILTPDGPLYALQRFYDYGHVGAETFDARYPTVEADARVYFAPINKYAQVPKYADLFVDAAARDALKTLGLVS